MKRKGKRLLSWVLTLTLMLSLMPGMGLTAYATTPTETLLTTITGAGSNAGTATSANVSYSVEGVATLTFSGSVSYQASPAWGWWGYGWSATVNAAQGYTITKCIFYDDANRDATDSSSPFVVETTEEDKTPRVNGNPIDGGDKKSKGIKKIEVYGYSSTSAATYSVTVTPGSNMTKTTDSGEASQTDLTGAMADVVYTADDGYYFPTNYSVAEVSGIKVTRDSYTQITVSGTPTADAAIALTAPTAKTTPDAPTTATATDCTTADNNDGKLTGVTAAMEYKKSDAADWTAGTGSDITGLVPGTYYVRVKATDTTLASDNQELTIASAHSHEFTYSASGATITATCGADGCTLPPSSEGDADHVATLTISAPTTGNDATVTVSPEGAIPGYTVQYQTKSGSTWGNETTAVPSTAGIHKASITLTGTGTNTATASVTYGNNCISYATNLEHGSIRGDAGATCGATISPTINPDGGYELDTLTVTPAADSGISIVTVNGGTFVMPEANVTVGATFKKINRAITVTQPATGGTITAKKDNADVTTADCGDAITLGNTPADGYNFDSYSVIKTDDSNTTVTVDNGAFTMPGYPVTVTGSFTPIDYTVTVNSASHGSVKAKKGTSDVTTANIGDEITLTYNPSAGYQLDTVTVTKEGGGNVTVSNNKFTMPASAVTVSATFKEITYTVAVDGAKATVTDSLPTPNTYTAELKNVPDNKTYDGEPVNLAGTVQKSDGFPSKVNVSNISWKDQDGNAVTENPTNVGTYTASATVGDKTISKSFKINGQTNSITYVKKTKGSPVLTTTNQYIPVVNNPNGITVLKEGRIYVAKGNIEIGALIYMGDVKLILGKNTTLTVYAGIYHIGSSLKIYPEQGAEETSNLIVKGNKTLASLNNYADFNGQTISDANAALSGTIGVYGGKLTVEQGNSKLVSDDISLTLGAGVNGTGLTGGTGNSDGSVTYGSTNLSGLTSLSLEYKQPTSGTSGGSSSTTPTVSEGTKAAKSAIDALPAAADVKLSDADAIEKARKGYDALSDSEKQHIDAATLKKLTDAEAALKALKDAESAKQIEDTVKALDALPAAADVKLEDKEAIEKARAAYDALSDEQKTKVSPETLKKLTDAEAALKAAEGGEPTPGEENAYDDLSKSDKKKADEIAKAQGVDKDTAAQMVKVADELGVSLDTVKLSGDTLAKMDVDSKDAKGTDFGKLTARATKRTNSALTLKWAKQKKADGYLIYSNKSGKGNKMKLVKTIKKNGTVSFTQKKLKKGTYYKYMVVAYKNVNGEKMPMVASVVIHVPTKGGKVTAAKSVKVTDTKKKAITKASVKKGKTFQLKASEVKEEKKLKINTKKKIKFESSDPKVATVNNSGKITGKKKGKATVWAYAQNGIFKAVKVTVK